jgi:hypothetical protein
MSLCHGNLAEYQQAKQLTVQEYLTKLEHTVKQQKQKQQQNGR